MKNENGIEKSAILKGSTKYRDIDTDEVLDTFDESRNLELVSVRMPVLTTSNEDSTKSNTLTVNEPIELRGIGDVKDTLDLTTGELTQRIGEIVLDGSDDEEWSADTPKDNINRYLLRVDNLKGVGNTYSDSIKCDKWRVFKPVVGKTENKEGIYINGWGDKIQIGVDVSRLSENSLNGFKQWLSKNPLTVQFLLGQEVVKTVDLTTVDQDGQPTKLKTFNDISHVEINADNLIPSVDVEVATKISETLSTMGLQHHDISETQNKLSQTVDEQTENTDATMMATTEIYEQTL